MGHHAPPATTPPKTASGGRPRAHGRAKVGSTRAPTSLISLSQLLPPPALQSCRSSPSPATGARSRLLLVGSGPPPRGWICRRCGCAAGGGSCADALPAAAPVGSGWGRSGAPPLALARSTSSGGGGGWARPPPPRVAGGPWPHCRPASGGWGLLATVPPPRVAATA